MESSKFGFFGRIGLELDTGGPVVVGEWGQGVMVTAFMGLGLNLAGTLGGLFIIIFIQLQRSSFVLN